MRGERLIIAKNKVNRLLRKNAYYWNDGDSRFIGMLRKTRVFCSSCCCGNPRRHKVKNNYKSYLTKQEIIANNELKWFEKNNNDIEILERENWEIEDHLEGLRIGESDFYDD